MVRNDTKNKSSVDAAGAGLNGSEIEMEVGGKITEALMSTPIPGLRVEVHEERNTTPVAIHEVLTDQEGRPLSEVQVSRDSDVIILSMDEKIARFEVSGPASEFAAPAIPTVVATPMIEALNVCRGTMDGTPIAQFFYDNMNENGAEAGVPVTGLTAYLYRTPNDSSDDLHLNNMYQTLNKPIIPSVGQRDAPPLDNEQVFVNGQNSFAVPYDPEVGDLVWDFIGKRTTVNSETNLCQGEVVPSCEELSREKILKLFINVRATVTGVLKAAARVMRTGPSPYLKTSAKAIRAVKIRSLPLYGALVCPKNVPTPAGCKRAPFPFDDFINIHGGIFKKPSPVNPNLFVKLSKAYNAAYRKFLYETFPEEIVYCKK